MTFEVQSTPRAQADIARIFAWLSERSPEGAGRWLQAFEEAAVRLSTAPLSCGISPESDDFDDEIRHLFFGTRHGKIYRALFRIMGNLVQVLCIRGPGERPVRPEDLPG